MYVQINFKNEGMKTLQQMVETEKQINKCNGRLMGVESNSIKIKDNGIVKEIKIISWFIELPDNKVECFKAIMKNKSNTSTKKSTPTKKKSTAIKKRSKISTKKSTPTKKKSTLTKKKSTTSTAKKTTKNMMKLVKNVKKVEKDVKKLEKKAKKSTKAKKTTKK